MRPTHRMTYALKALVDLALHQGTGPVTTAAVARRQGIPLRSLEQLFNRLRRKGLVEAERGPRGGYRLKRPADQIPVSAVFEALEQRRPLSDRAPAGGDGRSARGSSDPVKALWRQLEAAVQNTLKATTLQTLADPLRDQADVPMEHRYTFHI